MQKQNWSSFVIALIYMALGVVFIIRPEGVESILCYILAAALAVMGLLYLLGYFISPVGADGRRSGNGFVIGILLIFMALFIVVKQELIISLVPFLFGVMILIRGLFTVQAAFYMKRISGRFLEPVIAGLALMGLGLFIMLFPFETAKVLFILIGVGMILGGLMAIAEEIVVRIMVRRRDHDLERARDMATPWTPRKRQALRRRMLRMSRMRTLRIQGRKLLSGRRPGRRTRPASRAKPVQRRKRIRKHSPGAKN